MGNKWGFHSGVGHMKDCQISGDLYVQDDIVFSDVSAGTLGITGGIDMQSTTSAIGIDMGGTFSTSAINIDGSNVARAIQIGTKTTGMPITTSGLPVDTDPNNYMFGLFSVVASTAATSSDELRGAWIRTRVNTNMDIGSNAGWGYGVCGAEVQLKFYGGTTKVYAWQNSALWAQLESEAATTTFQSGSYTQCVLANIGLTTATLASGAVIAGVTINANTASLTNTGNAYYGLFITDKNTTSTDFTSGVYIADSVATTGVTIGLCTTGISIPGATTTGLSVTDATTGMLLTFANSKTEGISITTATGKTLGTGMSISGAGTTTTGILLDATTMTDGIKIDGSCSGSALNITPASGKTVATGITIVQQSGGILTTAITAGGSINVTLDAPTAQINALYGLINASASSTGNLVAVRGKVIVTGTTAKVSKTAVWAGIELSTVYTETGLTCAVNAQISSSSAQCPNSIVHIQSLPLSGGNFANVPYLCFSEGINAAPAGTGSNILFEVGHASATTTPTIGTGKLFYQNTLQIAVNQTAGVRTAFYIPLSTAEASYTTAYPIVSSCTSTAISVTGGLKGMSIISTLTGTGNLDANTITVTDNTTAGAYCRGMAIGVTAAGAKTGSGEVDGLGIDMTYTGNTVYGYNISLYGAGSGNPTLGFVSNISIYQDNLGNAVSGYVAIDIGIALSDAPSGRYTYMRFRDHSSAIPTSVFRFEGAHCATNFFEYMETGTPDFVISAAVSSTQDKKIRVNCNGTPYYIPMYIA